MHLKTALTQAEARYKDLLLQHQQIVAQLQESQESYCLSESKLDNASNHLSDLESQLESITIQRDALQTALDTAAARITALEFTLSDLEQQYDAETRLRKEAETTLFKLEETFSQSKQTYILENESCNAHIAELRCQLTSAESQLALLQQALDEAVTDADGLSKECADLTQRLQEEVHRRIDVETSVVKLKEAYAKSEQILLEKGESQDAENTVLQGQLKDAKARQATLQVALDESATRIRALTEECTNLAEQRDVQIMVRTALEDELNGIKQQYSERTHEIEDRHSITINSLEKRIRILEQHNAWLSQEFRTSEYQARGVCRHCGGTYVGIFRKKCINCGQIKDY